MAIQLAEKYQPLADFVIQMVVGAIAFALILLVAVAVAGFIQLLSRIGFSPPWLIQSAEGIERVIFWVDVVYYSFFVASELAKVTRTFWREWKLG